MNSLEKIFSRVEIDREARERFELGVGWRFGLVFSIFLLLGGWGWDTYELIRASADLPWSKSLLAALTLIPLGTVVGWVAGRPQPTNISKFILWGAGGALTGLIAIHLPFEGTSAFAALLDPAARGVMIFPFPPAAAERLAGAAAFGAVAGLVAFPVQKLGTAWAWDRSSSENQITRDGWTMLLVCAPLALGLGALYDGTANAQLRGPFELMQRRIEIAFTTPPDLDLQTMDSGRVVEYVSISKWRSDFTPHYVQYLSNFEQSAMKDAFIDVVFDNGFVWRCQSLRFATDLFGCTDMAKDYRGYMRQFLQGEPVQCDNCSLHVEPEAATWRAQMRGRLDDSKQITVTHHAGGIVLVGAIMDSGAPVECRFMGADLVQILDCASL
jgi:hypothetical protein